MQGSNSESEPSSNNQRDGYATSNSATTDLFYRSILRLLRRPEHNFTGKRLWRLGHKHGHNVGNVAGAQHLAQITAGVRREFGVYRAGTHHRHANVVAAQLFGDRIGQAVQPPFGSGVSCPVGE